MPQIKRDGASVMADDIPLQNLKLVDVQENIVLLRQSEPNDFLPLGYTLIYFMDSAENAQKMKSGQIPYLLVPEGSQNPITDVWTKKYAKKGTESILGILQGNSNEDIIYIHFMTVRPGYKRNHINSNMINILREKFPNAQIEYSSKTPDGKKFQIKEDAKISPLNTATVRPISKDMESIELRHFPTSFSQDHSDIVDDTTQPGFMGFGIYDDNENIKGYIYGYSVSEDELSDADDLEKDDIEILDPRYENSLTNFRQIITSTNAFYVSNLVVERPFRTYVGKLIKSLLLQARQNNKKFIIFDALSDTGKLFINPTNGEIRQDRLNSVGLKIIAKAPSGYDSELCVLELV